MQRNGWMKWSLVSLVMALGVSVVSADETGMMPNNGRPQKMMTEEVHVKAEVVAIDHKLRTISLKGPEGNVVDLEVDSSVQRFEAIKKGDIVNVDYLESLAIYIQNPGEAPMKTGASSYIVRAKGKQPAAKIVQTATITSTVESINYKTREITLKGPEGNLRTMVVGPEVKRFKEVKKGDQLVVSATANVAISVSKPQ